MEEKVNLLTKQNLKDLRAELEDLKVNKRKEIAAKIKEAREQGDLSENAEYDAAKDEQRDIEARIDELENIIKNSKVVDTKKIDFDKIHMGCKVKVRDMATRREYTYQIVSTTEVNSREKKISYESPIGAALMNKEVDEIVQVTTPGGELRLRVLDIQKAEL
ncbi:MAG: transcription elongation factor GreA [Lachnospiraceae bacterium]|nr:transcription elongation factor GreA [Lachnospiraceae bacterium]